MAGRKRRDAEERSLKDRYLDILVHVPGSESI